MTELVGRHAEISSRHSAMHVLSARQACQPHADQSHVALQNHKATHAYRHTSMPRAQSCPAHCTLHTGSPAHRSLSAGSCAWLAERRAANGSWKLRVGSRSRPLLRPTLPW